MQQSCLLCISTLLESGNRKLSRHCHPSTINTLTVVCAPLLPDFSKMFELKDDTTGQPLFETISITLVCSDCMKSDHPELVSYHSLKHRQRALLLT